MSFVHKENTGLIFKNEERKSDQSPQAMGSAMINGELYYISAWTKEGKKGKFQSLAFKRVDETKTRASPSKKEQPSFEIDDDIPF